MAAAVLVVALVRVFGACSGDHDPGSDSAEGGSGRTATSTTTIPPMSESELGGLLRAADVATTAHDWAAARRALDAAAVSYPRDRDVTRRAHAVDVFEQQASDAVPTEERPRHAFFHSLVIDPAKAFDHDGDSAGYQEWMTTRDEFARILDSLLERGWMLIDIEDLFDVDAAGTPTPAVLKLPPGRKPLVISIDDVNYYPYMEDDGFPPRLGVDDRGVGGTVMRQLDGSEAVTRDGDVMPLLDEFILDHPEFSYQGARGLMAVTGYAGALGYRTNDLARADHAQLVATAAAVAARYRDSGWRFASHSYTHSQRFKDASISLAQLRSDIARWKAEVEPITGPVNVFVGPFGFRVPHGDPRAAELAQAGFEVLCPVSSFDYLRFQGPLMVMDRINFDGLEMRVNAKYLVPFFDPAKVRDAARDR